MASNVLTRVQLLVSLALLTASLRVASPNVYNAQVDDNRRFVVLDDGETACLDGSPYAFWVWPGNTSEWSITIQGGGWCLNETLCETRASISARGSSRGCTTRAGLGAHSSQREWRSGAVHLSGP